MSTIVTGKNDKLYYRSVIEMLTGGAVCIPDRFIEKFPFYMSGDVKVTRMTSFIFDNLEATKEYARSYMENIFNNIMNGYIKFPHPIDPRYIRINKGDGITSSYIYYDRPGVPDYLKTVTLFRRTIQNIVICDSGSARYIKMGGFIISKKNGIYIITDHRGIVCDTFGEDGIRDIADLLDKVSDIIEPMGPDTVSGDEFNLPINFNKNNWQLIVRLPIEVNSITINPGTVLGVKDKFPGDNDADVEKGYWQIKDSYGGTFNMSYEDRKKYFEGVI